MEIPAPSSVPTVVAFDVDKTLTRRDCVVPFLRRSIGWRSVPRIVAGAVPLGWAALRRDRDLVKSKATRMILTGLRRRDIEDIGAAYAEKILESWMRSDTVQRLRWHRERGHRIVLVSASYSAYLQHLGSRLGCVGVLSCEVEFDEADRCTGKLIDGNCRGAEKERRLRRWLEDVGLETSDLFAYGDSQGDAELLAMATWPTRVTRTPIPAAPPGLESMSDAGRTASMT